MAHVDYYFSVLSPYAYLAGDGLERIAEARGASVAYKPVDFRALMARMGGAVMHEAHPARAAYMAQDLARLAARQGVSLTPRPAHWPTNPAPAAYAIIGAQAAGGDTGALVRALMRACWAEDRDMADGDVIRACLTTAGFDPDLADSSLLIGAETYSANNEEAAERGVIGVPFYITDDGAAFWGQDRLEDLDRHLAGAA
ncbi:2-hydroxychromene-2-carboxylate isomerase [Roseovarius sp. Pro17]|uniref:2-hydroxychromene-2-carboxylate isomerase n=1 Tax=Roseovarius sp. Pro17 TaxID=3108175 RepID=UPI002D7793B7|nr:2-hydroxychromene-2-carboxylate isomerase [Roseovarius sp. Pro17]